jgi:hypothetical protein
MLGYASTVAAVRAWDAVPKRVSLLAEAVTYGGTDILVECPH